VGFAEEVDFDASERFTCEGGLVSLACSGDIVYGRRGWWGAGAWWTKIVHGLETDADAGPCGYFRQPRSRAQYGQGINSATADVDILA